MVLVTGATGYVGQPCGCFRHQARSVVGLARNAAVDRRPATPSNATVVATRASSPRRPDQVFIELVNRMRSAILASSCVRWDNAFKDIVTCRDPPGPVTSRCRAKASGLLTIGRD